MSASSTDVRRVPRGWREDDAILLARSRSPLTFAGSEAQARWGALGGAPSLDLSLEVRSSRGHASAPGAPLVHDVSEGGLAVALAEAALWSGVGATLDLDDEPLTLFGEIGGQVILALPAGQVEPDPTGSDVESGGSAPSAATRSSASRSRSSRTRTRGSA